MLWILGKEKIVQKGERNHAVYAWVNGCLDFSGIFFIILLALLFASCALFSKGMKEKEQITSTEVPDTSTELVQNVLEEIPQVDTSLGLSGEKRLLRGC